VLAGVAGRLVVALAGGADPLDALTAALPSLTGDPDFVAAVSDLVRNLTLSALTDAALITALTTNAANLITDILAIPEVRTVAGTQLAALLISDPTLSALLGKTMSTLLAQPALSAALSDLLTGVLPTALGTPALAGALADAVAGLTAAVLGGTDPLAALQTALSGLAAAPAVQNVIRTTVPRVVNIVLGNADLGRALGQAAGSIATDLLTAAGITIKLLNGIVFQVVNSTVKGLLASPAVTKLVSTLGVDILTGSSLSDVTNTALRSVVSDWPLQQAIGAAIGQGVGSLFGDNIIGLTVSAVVGFNASVLLLIGGAIARLFIGGGPVAGAAAAVGAVDNGYFFELLPTAGDRYTMRATILDGPEAAVVRSSSAAGSPFVLHQFALSHVDDAAQPGFLKLRMTVDGAQLSLGSNQDVQLLVTGSFGLDELIPTAVSTELAAPVLD
jgi:hypothetical protein